MFCGLLSPDRRHLTYVNAGQIPPFLLRADGTLTRVEAAGMPVAMIPDWQYQNSTLELHPGDLLVVVSDGLMEARNPTGQFWSETEVPTVIARHGNAPLNTLPAEFCAHADAWAAGIEQYDDITVVGLRVRA